MSDLVQNGHYLLLPPGRNAIREMIVRPAELAAVSFEADLETRILEDLEIGPGSLPILAYALSELYQLAGKTQQLTGQMYEQLGGIKGLIARQAEKSLSSVDSVSENDLHSLFQYLVKMDTAGLAVRKRAGLAEIRANPNLWSIATRLLDARILVSDSHEGIATLEVAHETIFEAWPRFHLWIDQNRKFLQWSATLTGRVSDWLQANRDNASLLSGRQLVDARRWLTSHKQELTGEELLFVEASIAESERQRRIRLGNRLSDALQLLLNDPRHSRQMALLLALESMRLWPTSPDQDRSSRLWSDFTAKGAQIGLHGSRSCDLVQP